MALKTKRRRCERRRAKRICRGWKKKKEEKQGNVLAAPTIRSHVDKVRKKKKKARDSDNSHPISEERRHRKKKEISGASGIALQGDRYGEPKGPPV
jgi:hypothetical protein